MKRKSAMAACAAIAALGTAAATSAVAAAGAASASGVPQNCGFACRGDISQLPAALKNRLIVLHDRPHTFDPMQVFAEAPKPSLLVQYYLMDTKHFQPNIFTTTAG